MTQHSNTDSTTDRNFSQAELDKFGALANRWWDPQGPQKALHALNPARLGYVAARTALPGAQVLDVGCGAGLLSEAMAGEGAQVVALDLAPELIKIARLHRLETGVSVDYRLQSVESLAVEMPGRFDAITCMELLEHVPDPASIIDACATLLKPGGKLFVSTVNRTPAAFALAIVGAEYVARLLPRGTHQYRDFIKPSELGAWLRASGLQLEDVSGLLYEPWRNAARVIARTDVNYLACASRPVIEGPDCGEPDCGEHAVRKEREGAQKKTEARLFSRVLRPSRTVFSTDSATLAGAE